MKHSQFKKLSLITLIFLAAAVVPLETAAQGVFSAPQRAEGDGPYKRLILHGAIVIDGTGAIPFGPSQIIIENNRIVSIRGVGIPGMYVSPPPQAKAGEKVLSLTGL